MVNTLIFLVTGVTCLCHTALARDGKTVIADAQTALGDLGSSGILHGVSVESLARAFACNTYLYYDGPCP